MTSLEWAVLINVFSLLLIVIGLVNRYRNRRRRDRRAMKLHLTEIERRHPQ